MIGYRVPTSAGIYILAIQGKFVQIEKQGRIWRRTFKKEKEKGGKEKKKKRKHTLKYLMKLKWPQKIHKNSEEF